MSAPPGSAPRSSPPIERLRLLSCNIVAGASVGRYSDYVTRSWLPHPGKRANLEALARSIEDFDVVGLQEADAGTLRSGFMNQTQYVAETAGFPYWSHQPNRRVSRLAQSANGLISRIEPSEVIDHPLPGRIPGRGALLARFGTGNDALTIVISHLSLGPEARMRQLGFIAELLSDAPHAVLMGDLNCTADSPELRELYRKTSLAPPIAPPPTFPSWRPRRAIDHILVSESMQIDSLWTLPQAFSDHLPVAASVTLPSSLQLGLRRAA